MNQSISAILILGTMLVAAGAGAQCSGRLSEAMQPPAVRGMSIGDGGFRASYWAWDDLNRRRGGRDQPLLRQTSQGILLADLDWSRAGACQVGGPVGRTAVLFEALGHDGFGRWALVNLGADADGNVDVDAAQRALGSVSSRAVPVPRPRVAGVRIHTDRVVVDLEWSLQPGGDDLSDLVGTGDEPLSSVRGYAVYVINGPAPTPRPWDWSLARDAQPDAVNGFSTDTRATITLPRAVWLDSTVAFALALTYDGDGDAEGERPESRSVHGSYLGAPSDWLALPPLGVDRPIGVANLRATRSGRCELRASFDAVAEPVGASYRLWLVSPGGRRQHLVDFPGGAARYDGIWALPPWAATGGPWLELEMLEPENRVVARAGVWLVGLTAVSGHGR